MWPDTLAVIPLPWSKPAGVSWVPPLCNWEQQIHGQTRFSLEKSRLHVLIRFSTHELIAQHMSKHQHFCLHLALTPLSPPLCTKCCRQRMPAPRGNRSSSLRMGKRGTKTGKEMCTEEMAVPIPVAQSNHLTENSSLHLNLSP